MKEEIKKLVEEQFGGLALNEEASSLVEAFVQELINHEKVDVSDVVSAGSGKTCINLKIGEYIFKVGKTRRTKEFKNSSRILQPVIRREIEFENEEKIFVEVQNVVEAEWYKDKNVKVADVMYQVYKDIREQGLVWTDIRFTNIGRLLKDNKVNYTTKVHDKDGNIIEQMIEPSEKATGLKGKQGEILKAGDYVLLDTDFVFDENNLPDNKSIKECLLPIWYENYELRYQKEKNKAQKKSR